MTFCPLISSTQPWICRSYSWCFMSDLVNFDDYYLVLKQLDIVVFSKYTISYILKTKYRYWESMMFICHHILCVWHHYELLNKHGISSLSLFNWLLMLECARFNNIFESNILGNSRIIGEHHYETNSTCTLNNWYLVYYSYRTIYTCVCVNNLNMCDHWFRWWRMAVTHITCTIKLVAAGG